MHAVLIDPFKREVTDIEYSGDWREIRTLIDCDIFTVAHIGDGNDVFVDDEGLLKDLYSTAFFAVDGYPQPLAGKGLVLGCDDEGESVSPSIKAEDLKVKWLDLHDVANL